MTPHLRLLALLLLGACGRFPPPPPPPPPPLTPGALQAGTFELVCPSILGNLTTTLTYSVTASFNPIPAGEAVTFSIDAPIAQVNSPVTATFISSSTTFSLPAGFQAASATTSPATTADFTSSSAVLDGGAVTLELQGSFPLDGSSRPVPALVVTGQVTGAVGTSIVWSTPTVVQGEASAGIFGDQSSSCTIQAPGSIGSTSIEAGSD